MAKDLIGEMVDEEEGLDEGDLLAPRQAQGVRRSELSRLLPEMLESLGVEGSGEGDQERLSQLTDLTMKSVKSLSQLAEFLAALVMNAGRNQRSVSLADLLGHIQNVEGMERASRL